MSILLIDGLNLIRRVHAGVPEVSEDRDGAVLNACVASMRRHYAGICRAMFCW